MHYKIPDQLEYISKYCTLEPGDIILTGTPEGIDAVEEGDKIDAQLSYKGKILATIQETILRER